MLRLARASDTTNLQQLWITAGACTLLGSKIPDRVARQLS